MCPGLQLISNPLILRLILHPLLGRDVRIFGQTELCVFPQLGHVLTLATTKIAIQILLDLVHRVPVKTLLLMGLGCFPAFLTNYLRLPHVELADMFHVIIEVGEISVTMHTPGKMARAVLQVKHQLLRGLEIVITLPTDFDHFG